jgi:hypothetical protein
MEGMNMRGWSCFVVVCALAGCSGGIINAGSDGDGGNSANGGGGGGTTVVSDEGDGGATVIASEIQELPSNLVSDGTSLFWVSGVGAGSPISRMSVNGGVIETVVPGPLPGGFLAVDDVNVYYLGLQGDLYRAPKGGGGSPTLVNESGASIAGVTVLGSRAYWFETLQNSSTIGRKFAMKSAPLQGGSVSVIAEFSTQAPSPFAGGVAIGVTMTTFFISGLGTPLSSFPLSSGVPDGGPPANVPGAEQYCNSLVSDMDAVYCEGVASSITRVASDGTTTTLGMTVGGAGIAFDDTYVYWTDDTTVGTITKVPKTGGTATVLARDTNPGAIAVDATSVYWGDMGGNIKRLPK